MRTTMDRTGRLVIPKDVRRQAGLEPGTPLNIRWRDGCIEIEPAALPVKLVRRGRLLVAIADAAVAPLRGDVVEATRQVLAHDRDRGA